MLISNCRTAQQPCGTRTLRVAGLENISGGVINLQRLGEESISTIDSLRAE